MKLLVKFRTSCAGDRFSFRRGQQESLPRAEAEQWIAAGFAELVPDDEAVRAELAELKAQVAAGEDPAFGELADVLAGANANLAAALA